MNDRRRVLRRISVSIAVIAAAVLMFGAATAQAAGFWTPLPTSKCTPSGAWFTSTNVRTVHSGCYVIKLQVTQAPGGGLALYAKNYNTGLRIGSIVYSPPINTPLTLGSTSPGTDFVNVFKLQESYKQPYYWTGSEFY
jgi:hypothetical protein